MDINLESYKVFFQVANCKSFSKAAEQLYISQPAVTQSIKKLEENLGGALFYRNSKGISLTEEGRNLYNFIESSIKTLDNAKEKFEQYKNLEKGKIVIKGTRTVIEQILEKPLIKFIKDYPNINIDLLNGGHIDTLKELSEGKIDLALVNLPVTYEYKNIEIKEIAKKEFVFVAGKEFIESNKIKSNKINIENIEKYSIIAPRKETKYRELFDNTLNIQKEYKYEIMSESMQKKLALENVGIAFLLKERVEKELEENKLIELNLECPIISVGAGILKDNIANYATKKLLEYIIKYQ